MNTGAADSFGYCSAYVRRVDEDRWLSAQFASRPLRERLIALYALHLEIVEVPAKVTEPLLGEVRLQWWREALREIVAGVAARAHPVVEAVKAAGILDARALEEVEAAIGARARELHAEPLADVDDLAGWLRASEAYLAPLAVRLSGAGAPDSAGLLDAATAFALAREGVIQSPKLAEEARSRARGLMEESAPALRRFPAAAAPAVLHFALTRRYLRDRRAPSPVGKRWSLFLAMAAGRI